MLIREDRVSMRLTGKKLVNTRPSINGANLR